MKRFQVVVNGNSYEVEVEELAAGVSASPAPAAPTAPVAVPVKAAAAPAASAGVAGANKITAPMPGKIVSISVEVGQSIAEGDLVGVLEAMKMENEIFASAGGTVASVNVGAGAAVETGDVIVTIN